MKISRVINSTHTHAVESYSAVTNFGDGDLKDYLTLNCRGY